MGETLLFLLLRVSDDVSSDSVARVAASLADDDEDGVLLLTLCPEREA